MRALLDFLTPGKTVFMPTLSNESAWLSRALHAEPDRARDVNFLALQFPGIDAMDYLALHPTARQTSCFMSPALRSGLSTNRANFLPLDYLGMIQYLEHQSPPDVAIAHLTAPDQDGWCAPGLSCDFLPLVWSRAQHRLAHINACLPRLNSSFRVHMSELDAWVAADEDVLDFKEPPAGELERAVGRWAAELIRDGDTLQFGIGAVPLGLAHHLRHHRRLQFHGGLVASALQTLNEAGALDNDARITTGVVLGNAAFRDYVRGLDNLWLTDTRDTHANAARDSSRRFVAINSAIEVDLFGQVNAERMGGTVQAGPGGLPAFARAALSTPGGRLLICLPATARRGSVSRIVPTLSSDSACTLPGYLADVVITEYGAAQIRHLAPDARAQALIDIAAPDQRDLLRQAWRHLRSSL